MRGALLVTVVFYPLFAVLDYLEVPREWWWLFWLTRGAFVLTALGLFPVLRRPVFARHPNTITSAFIVLGAAGISLMTVFLGGLASPYYAGLGLVIVASALLFVWPEKVVVATHGTIVVSYIVLNLLFGPHGPVIVSVSNLCFLSVTAVVISIGQIVNYRAQYADQRNQVLLEQTKTRLEAAHEQLQQLDKLKSEFFANITHELKTPLAMILVPLELMLDRPGEEGLVTHRTTLQTMYRHSMKMLKLVNDLLDLSKLEDSRLRLSIAEHDLVQCLRDLTVQVLPLAKRKAIELDFRSDTPSCKIWCDIERVERVFINLLSNSMKFSSQHGHVSMVVHEEADAVSIDVVDDGVGFPPEMSSRVFDRFFQVDSGDTRKHGGTGIGLTLSKQLVELHGGTIRAAANAEQGATFTVRLQKGRDHFPKEALERRVKSSDRPSGQRIEDRGGVGEWQLEAGARYRLIGIDEATEQRTVEREMDETVVPYSVLVVDDTPDVIRLIHLTLNHLCRILAAPDGNKGFELATTHLPSLIITDLMMPEVDGLELIRRLRADSRTRQIPIVMLTARGDLQDRIAGIETGANAYLTKPFSPHELLSIVKSMLHQQEIAADTLLAERMDSLETIAGGLAHEINNPLNYIKGALVSIEHDCERLVTSLRHAAAVAEHPERGAVTSPGADAEVIHERLGKMLKTAHQGVVRIAKTVDLMRRYSREGFTRVTQPYDAHRAIHDVLEIILPAMGRNVNVETSFEGDGTLECVPEEFNQVIANLIQNAVEAVPEGTGRVSITAKEAHGELVLSVRDNGRGVSPTDRAKIFTPFFTTKDVGRGMGLGLTITRRVVSALSGTIRVQSAPEGGAEFVVRLPRKRP